MTDLAGEFQAPRPHLFALADRLLGSAAEAEEDAYLCLTRLTSAHAQRVGEPVPRFRPDPAHWRRAIRFIRA